MSNDVDRLAVHLNAVREDGHLAAVSVVGVQGEDSCVCLHHKESPRPHSLQFIHGKEVVVDSNVGNNRFLPA